MAFLRWRLDDGVTSYTFGFNPNEMDSPFADLPVAGAAATDGTALLLHGESAPKDLTFAGVLLDQAQYDALLAWTRNARRLTLFDHFGRSMSVFIQSFEPQTVRSRNQWKHTYQMRVLVLSEPVMV